MPPFQGVLTNSELSDQATPTSVRVGALSAAGQARKRQAIGASSDSMQPEDFNVDEFLTSPEGFNGVYSRHRLAGAANV